MILQQNIILKRDINSNYHNFSSNTQNNKLSFQALNSQQQRVFNDIEEYLGKEGRKEANKTLGRLKKALDGSFKDKTVLVAYGGGKDSSYMTAFMRYLQLKILEPKKVNDTFKMRIVTNRQSHMPKAVMRNIDNVFEALGIYKDKNVEAMIVDGDKVIILNSKKHITNLPIPSAVKKRDRKDMLMAGHLTNAEPRRVYCDACNVYMQKGEAHAITAGNGVNLVVTGDSLTELCHYKIWIDNLYKFVTRGSKKANATENQDFMYYMKNIGTIAKEYFTEIHGAEGKSKYKMPELTSKQPRPKLFTIYSDTSYDAGAHRKMLDKFLGFKFDTKSLAFSFTESDCSMPALMAHLRGLKVEKLYNRSYKEGIGEYVEQLAIPLMKKKHIPDDLIQMQKELYYTDGKIDDKKIQRMRKKVSKYYKSNMGLTEDNIVCMVYSPFASRGKNLEMYLKNEKPELVEHMERINSLFLGKPCNTYDKQLIKELENASGLTFRKMRHLYTKELLAPQTGLIEIKSHSSTQNSVDDLITRMLENPEIAKNPQKIESLLSGKTVPRSLKDEQLIKELEKTGGLTFKELQGLYEKLFTPRTGSTGTNMIAEFQRKDPHIGEITTPDGKIEIVSGR